MHLDLERFGEWEQNTHIPQKIMDMVNFIAANVGCGFIEEETITLRNRGGYTYGYAKGFSLTHCTSSYADGPSPDYSQEMAKWLKGLDFSIENSYGDNGMDSATNWHDTIWTHEFIYKPSLVYEEKFMEYDEEDYDE